MYGVLQVGTQMGVQVGTQVGYSALTRHVEGIWLTSAMKFMTKGVAGLSKISFGVPTCSIRPLHMHICSGQSVTLFCLSTLAFQQVSDRARTQVKQDCMRDCAVMS